MKLVINRCFGGFGLSDEACERLIALGVPRVPMDNHEHGRAICDVDHPESEKSPLVDLMRKTPRLYGRYSSSWFRRDENRGDPQLVQVVEELGERANGRFGKLAVVEIPDGVDYEIDEYDGRERVRERSRSWP